MNRRLFILTLALLLSAPTWAAGAAKYAVVIIDMQEGFYAKENTKHTKEVKALVAKQLELIRWAKSKNVPVIIFEYKGEGATDSRLTSALRGRTHMVIEKATDDGFSQTFGNSREIALAAIEAWEVNHLIVSGINGGSCVMETIQGAVVSGLTVHSSSDLVGDLWSNPPTYPDSSWRFQHRLLKPYPSLAQLLRKIK